MWTLFPHGGPRFPQGDLGSLEDPQGVPRVSQGGSDPQVGLRVSRVKYTPVQSNQESGHRAIKG